MGGSQGIMGNVNRVASTLRRFTIMRQTVKCVMKLLKLSWKHSNVNATLFLPLKTDSIFNKRDTSEVSAMLNQVRDKAFTLAHIYLLSRSLSNSGSK